MLPDFVLFPVMDPLNPNSEPKATWLARMARAEAEVKIERDAGGGLPFPRPYPGLGRRGRLWVKAGRYWVAYSLPPRPVILAVFYDSADIPGRF